MAAHADAALEGLRETFMAAQETYSARAGVDGDAAEERTDMEDAERAYLAACKAAGVEPIYED